jgi:hypothetical protein
MVDQLQFVVRLRFWITMNRKPGETVQALAARITLGLCHV